MNNLPDGVFSWEFESGKHYPECDDQPIGAPCICDQVELSEIDTEADVRTEEELERKVFSYNLDVRNEILEAIKL